MSDDVDKQLKEAMKTTLGEFPNGRLNADDAGAMPLAIGTDGKVIIIKFPMPTRWLGMTGDDAVAMAQALVDHARRVGTTKAFTITIGE